MAKARMRPRIRDLIEALTGRFSEHHAFVWRMHLDLYDHLTAQNAQVTTRIEEATEPFLPQLTWLEAIPGVSRRVAEAIVAETGGDMSRFLSVGHLTSWAGVCPDNN
ncbi:transposase [Streptomyces sp. Ru73]|uniref:transposase n=1 Tax=Streptomyces sp. Ru73 TaxID=2080748 RepID=UPI00215621BB|nr:transposase [Streptomyces sp. Ru73]